MPRKRQTEPAFVSPQYTVPDAVRIQAPEVMLIILRHCDGDLSRAGLTRATLAASAKLGDRKLALIYAALGEIERERDAIGQGVDPHLVILRKVAIRYLGGL